ncbi:cubilin, putative [Ixodes scapularis]|uniref:Cubilin, putative n=1 Tax=Ixodes scapularis TaxID=6945 RepID=B7PZ82_IXOSC|nr:cubilin, putative [Ixodes scapularis]|eukprot:XP_002404947.1 cubilin, putative [Ixodes scapularis]
MRRLQNNLRRDACSSNPCGHGGTCVSRYNGYLCLCPAGWQGGRCEEDVDECAHLAGSDLGCQNGATCVNTPGAYRCQCTQGFFGAHCTERQDDCSLASASALCDHGTCIGLPRVAGQPGFRCLCDQGWTTGPGQLSCSQDVNECASGRHFCSKNPPVACLNFPGGFGCGPCPQAIVTSSFFFCSQRALRKCKRRMTTSSITVDCFNTIGSRSCGPCPPGYVGDGVTCTYLGLCNVDNGGCSPLATCIEQRPWSPPGFLAQAFGNSFQCVCEAGFSGRLCDQAQGGCTSDPCQNNGTCHNDGPTGVACTCTPEWTGPLCEEPRQACGGQLYGTNGTLRYPETGEAYTHKRNCIWVLRTTRGKVLNVSFSEFHLEDGGSGCGFDFLEIHDGPTSMSRALGRYCGTTLRGKNLASTHDSLFLWFKTDSSVTGVGFALDWITTDPVCGRDFPVADVGSVSSPGYPGHYPSSRDCMWTVAVPPGKRIQIHLATVQMEHHQNCSYDFLKVYDGASERDQLLGTFCGSGAPGPRPVLTSSHLALLHFHSDDSSTDVGFHATYASVPGVPGCGGVLSRAKGRFTSPSYPSPYENGLLCEWEIRAAPEERLQITFDSFTLEQHSACRWDALEVYDGRDDNAPLLGRFCGSALPPAVLSHGSVLYVRFRTDQSTQLQGFSASYEAVCGGHWTSLRGELSSPRYPEPYPARRLCNYTIELPPGNLVQLDWQHMDIENDGHCAYDYVEVWEPWRNGSERRRGRYCGSVPPDPVTSAYNRLSLRFHSDHSVQHRGFLANYSALDIGCGGVLSEPGRLQSPASESAQSGYRHESHCRWLLKAPPGHTVRLSFSQFALEESTNCSYDYVEIHDSSDERVGRYCGGRAPPTITSTGELLHVLFRTDDSVARDGFLAHFEFLDGRTACGGEFFLSQGVVRSPLFPRHYPADRDCVWLLHVPDGRQIRLNFTHFDLENSTICAFDFLELRNGAQETSPLAGTFCGREAPVGFVSDSNSLRLRFVSDSSMFGQGFQVFYDSALTGCGGVLTGSSGSLMSPNYPRPYGHNAECRWLIRVSQGSRIALTVVDMDIEEQPDCGYDALEVFDGDSARGERKARLCNLQQRPGHLTSSGSTIFLRFRSDASGAGRGFHVVYTAMCSSVIRHQPRGVIESPNFPAPYPSNANCTWTIEALSGHNISLAFSTLEIEHEANCSYDYLEAL